MNIGCQGSYYLRYFILYFLFSTHMQVNVGSYDLIFMIIYLVD